MSQSYLFFDTPIGRCGIVWGERGLVRVQLPEADESRTELRLTKGLADPRPATPSHEIQEAIEKIIDLLSGGSPDFRSISLDLTEVPEFSRQVYAIARTIPPGATMTYGEIAIRLGDKLAARDVGQALGKNPFPIIIPCHRVVAANGKTGGFSAPGGVRTKLRMLAIERAAASGTGAGAGPQGSFGF
jgi:methylated-DNA-[protein]-cysteine S-methyltransferase